MDITLIGVPMDLGADRRGVDMGPSAIRYANLDEKLRALGHAVRDAGTVNVPETLVPAGKSSAVAPSDAAETRRHSSVLPLSDVS